MEIVTTGDGSTTYWNPTFKQLYHSKAGAIEEAFEKYVKPLQIKDGDVILDHCFGLGYNSLAAIATCKNLTIVALENDREMLLDLKNLTIPSKQLMELYDGFRSAIASALKDGSNDVTFTYNSSTIRLLVGDARETISKLNGSTFDAIFFDPFSNKVCPELWTKEVFAQCHAVLKPGKTLATYSCARVVKDAMIAAGFEIRAGPIVGRRAPCTFGVKPQ